MISQISQSIFGFVVFQNILWGILLIWALGISVILLVVGLGWIGIKIFAKIYPHHKISQKNPSEKQLAIERSVFWSEILIASGVGSTASALLIKYTPYIWDTSFTLSIIFAQFLVMILLFDTYFYWTHRAMHHPKLFRYFHAQHHQSIQANFWSSYNFDTSEILVITTFIPSCMVGFWAIGWSPSFLLTPCFLFYFNLWNIYGHSGYDFLPKFSRKFLNTSTKHQKHHEQGHVNYGFVFRFWDWACRTEK